MTVSNDFEQEIRQKPRVLDYVSVEGLERLTGCTLEGFVVFMIKELMDNALDKRDVRNIAARICEVDGLLQVSVSDDSQPLFTREMLDKVLDFGKAPSSKRGIKALRRGILGNALQCCFGISHSLWRDEGPEYTAEVWGSKRFMVALKPTRETVSVTVQGLNREKSSETVILFKLPLNSYVSPVDCVKTLALLNPQVNISYEEKGHKTTYQAGKSESPLGPAQDAGDIHWYSCEEFLNIAQEMETMAVERFVTWFKGFRHRSYGKKLLKVAGVAPGEKLSNVSSKNLRRIFEAMIRISKEVKVNRLPILGKESLKCESYALKRGIYRDREGRSVPFAVEAASYPNQQEEIIEAINFTASIHRPFTKWVWTTEDKKTQLYDMIKGKRISVLVHLICPNITWLSPSKGELDIQPFTGAIFSAVRGVCRQRKTNLFTSRILIMLTRKIMNSHPSLSYTIRQVFYRLVVAHGYPNTIQSYKELVKAMVQGRKSSDIDADRIVDSSRPEYINNSPHRTFADCIAAEVNSMIERVDLDFWESSPVYIEVWIEKEALSRVLLPTCRKFRINLIVGKGYSSYTQIYKAACHRFPKNGKKTIILYLGDHDPSGLHIEDKLRQRLVEEAGRRSIHLNLEVKRIALTYAQVERYNLPKSPLKKIAQKRGDYARKYGTNTWELDAIEPEILDQLLTESITELLDLQSWKTREAEIEACKEWLKKEMKLLTDPSELP